MATSAVGTGIAGLVVTVWGVIDRGPHRVALVDTEHLWISTRWVLITAVAAVLVCGLLPILPKRLTTPGRRSTVGLVALIVLIAVCWAGVRGALRLRQDAESMSGPSPTPGTGVLLVGLVLATVSVTCSVVAVESWTAITRDSLRRSHFRIRTTALTTVGIMVIGVGTALTATVPSTADIGPRSSPASLAVSGAAIPVQAATRVVHSVRTEKAQTAIVGGLLVIADDSAVSARDIATGAVRWTRSRPPLTGAVTTYGGGSPSELRPQLLTVDDDATDPTVIVGGESRIVAVAVRTGEIRWWSAVGASTTVLGASAGSVVVAREDEELQITDDGVDEVWSTDVVALDVRTGARRWSRPVPEADARRCDAEGAAVGGVVAYTLCGSGWSMRSMRDGSEIPARHRAGDVEALAAVGPLIVVTSTSPGRSSASVSDLFRPGSSLPMASIAGWALSPPVDGVMVTSRSGDVGRGDVGLSTIGAGPVRPLPNGLAADFSTTTTIPWTVSGTTLLGPADDRSSDTARAVIAAYDVRTRSATTIPSPCLRSETLSATRVGSTVVVQCSDFDDRSKVGEIVVVGRA